MRLFCASSSLILERQGSTSDDTCAMSTYSEKPACSCPDCGTPLPAGSEDAACPVCVLMEVLRFSPPGAGEPGQEELMRGAHIGDYEILEEVARGGMGVVYRARQVSLNRVVALKMILSGPFASQKGIERFRTEAQTAAGLQHPNIVAIHEVGEHEGLPFFSMDFVEGCTLAELVRKGPLPACLAATYGQKIAEAVQYAHKHQVLHRDLKPPNILIDASDQPRITDFGLARRLDLDRQTTLSGELLGTPGYMSPEQASGQHDQVRAPSDIYSLGAILYHLLTGRPPFMGDTVAGVLKQIAETDPAAPRLLNASVPQDLETICLKCLQKEPSGRYHTAGELAADLGRFLRQEPIIARPVGAAARAWRWCRRKPALAGALAAFVVALLVGVTGIIWQWQRAEGEATRANLGELEARRNLYAADMMLGFTALEELNYGRVRSLLANHMPGRDPSPSTSGDATSWAAMQDLRGWEWRYLWHQSQSDALDILGRHSNAVARLHASADGTLLASGSYDTTLKVWDPGTRELLATLPHEGPPTALAFSPDGAWLATGCLSEVGRLRLWRVGHWAASELLATNTAIGALAFSADSRYLVTSSVTELQVWDVMARRAVASRKQMNQPGHVWCHVEFAASDSQILVTPAGGEALLWEWQSTNEPARFRLQNENVFDLHWASDLGLLATAGGDKKILVWDLEARKELTRISTEPYWMQAVRFSPDGSLLASGGEDQRITFWDTTSWEPVRFLRGHSDRILALEFIPPEGRRLATGSADGTVRLWELASENKPADPRDWWEGWWWAGRNDRGEVDWHLTPISEPPFDKSALSGVLFWPTAVSSAGLMAAGIWDHNQNSPGTGVHLWDLQTGALRHTITLDEGPVRLLTFAGDGMALAGTVHPSNTVHLWNSVTGEELGQFETMAGRPMPTALAIAPNHQHLAMGWEDGRISLWSVDQGRHLGLMATHGSEVTALCFSPDGTLLASTGRDDRIRLTRVGAPSVSTLLQARPRWPISADISRDGRTLAVGDSHGRIHLFNLETGQQIGRLAVNQGMSSAGENIESGFVTQVKFLPDGDRLVSIAYRWYMAKEFLVRLWNAAHVVPTDFED